MITEEELTKHKWVDITIIEPEWDNSVVLVILIFGTKQEGNDFLMNILLKEAFGFATTIDNDTLVFTLSTNLNTDNAGLRLKTRIPKEHYPFKKWQLSQKKFFITTGVWIGERISDFGGQGILPIELLFFDPSFGQ